MQIVKTLALCVAITALCVYAAYQSRGYIVFGGEWMIWMVIVALCAQEERYEKQ